LKFEATGFFKAHHDGKRWWLVAPDGYAFWSSGLDCVRPDTDANIEGLEDALSWQPDFESQFKIAFHTSFEGHRHFNYLIANFIRAFGPDRFSPHFAERNDGLTKCLWRSKNLSEKVKVVKVCRERSESPKPSHATGFNL